MKKNQVTFNWAAFGVVLGASLTVAVTVAAFVSHSSVDLARNLAISGWTSLLFSVIFGGLRFIRNALGSIWLGVVKSISSRYLEQRVNQFNTHLHISGLKNNAGTVNLIVAAGQNDGLFLGQMVNVVTEPGDEQFGEAIVIQLYPERCNISPTNRINVTFWEQLEDRMKFDPSPPSNIVVKRQVPPETAAFLRVLLGKEERHAN